MKKKQCEVCNRSAHGNHFGVNSCRACAAFFRRSVVQGRKYQCRKANGNCLLTDKEKLLCRFCRYQKCISLGMTPESEYSTASFNFDHLISQLIETLFKTSWALWQKFERLQMTVQIFGERAIKERVITPCFLLFSASRLILITIIELQCLCVLLCSSEEVIERISDELHDHYTNDLKMPNYAARLTKIMDIICSVEVGFATQLILLFITLEIPSTSITT
ncbi:unnamed protein product [Haemonchus placei]|uniref:Nuclear receptor domain-containing protein n=1 Tax=Haemonchus placei TaxID=6290 RepID=A0A0N4WG41_HAEPC|nr:unnamed protein product [Haemonchus placei]